MLQVCIMGGHDGRLQPEKKIYLTMFGGVELTRPTVARQILTYRKKQSDGDFKPSRHIFITLFGGVDIKSPTLSEEFIDLRELLQSGQISLREWEVCMSDVAKFDSSISAFTFAGGFSESELPSEKEEIDSLAVQQYLGTISEQVIDILKFGVGQKDVDRRSTLRKALQVSV